MEAENLKITHIDRVEIKGLWGKYDIDWELNRDVNILVGINGSGKSTVLELIFGTTEHKVKILEKRLYFSEVIIAFNNHWKVSVSYIQGEYEMLRGKEPNQHKSHFITRINGMNYYFEFISSTNSAIEDHLISYQPNKIDHLHTFEKVVPTSEELRQVTDGKVKTQLDIELFQLLNQYPRFISKLSTRQRKTNSEDVFIKDDLFRNLVNQLFSKTQKTIQITDESDINFIVDNKQTLTPYELSSGEKQMLIILLKVLIQDNQPYILLMDEPEISLHLSWQVDLIDHIRKLNENCQVIIATHSPSIVQKGWNDKVAIMALKEESEKGIMYLNQQLETADADLGRDKQ